MVPNTEPSSQRRAHAPRRARAFGPLRRRLALAGVALSLVTFVGAALAIWGLSLTERRASEALAAQARIEAWSTLSTRMHEWLWASLRPAAHLPPPSTAPVASALAHLETLVAADVAAAGTDPHAQRLYAEMRYPAQMRGFFAQIAATDFGTPAGEAALAFHLSHAAPLVAGRIEHDTRRREAALRAMEEIATPLRAGAVGLGMVAPCLLVILWWRLFRPLFYRLDRVGRMADALVAGPTRAAATEKRLEPHDELGLMIARLRRASARLARRRAQLAQEKAALEASVATRTAELRRANATLAATDAARKRFFTDVSHELRTPLTVILGEADLGANAPDPATRQSFATIKARTLRLFRRIEDLLRIARSEAGQLDLARAPIDLRALLDLAAADLAPLRSRAGQSLTIEVGPDVVLAGDGDWLRQVFAGFMENTIKYAGKGAHLAISAVAESDHATIILEDNGPTPADHTPKTFARFDRGTAPPASGAGGFGVGLALASWIVGQTGGQLERLPSPQGFALKLTLPLWQKEALWLRS